LHTHTSNALQHRSTLFRHTRYAFTVTPLEEDGTLSLLQYGDKQIYLLGTAHISSKSADQVRQVINDVKPDTVFVELCPTRAAKLWAKIRANQEQEHKDLAPLTGEEWMDELPYAKKFKQTQQQMMKILEGFGFVYGGEFIAALEEAEKINAELVYGDRDVRETMERLDKGYEELWSNLRSSVTGGWKEAWQKSKEAMTQPLTKQSRTEPQKRESAQQTSWYRKSEDGKTESFGKQTEDAWNSWFGQTQQQSSGGTSGGFGGTSFDEYAKMGFLKGMKAMFEDAKKQREQMRSKMPNTNWSEIIGLFTNPEATIEAMKDRKKIREKFEQFKEISPTMVKGLVEERDEIMCANLKQCKGKVIVAVVGIGHMDGMEERFKTV